MPTKLKSPSRPVTRAPSTERAYLKRALWFQSYAAEHLGMDEPTPLDVARYAVERRPTWAKATWRQVKAALLYRYEGMVSAGARAAVELLLATDQAACQSKSNRTSGKRAKAVTPERLDSVIDGLRASTSKYAGLLEEWLLMTAVVGLRPHEWAVAEVIWASPEEMGDVEEVAQVAVEGVEDAQLPYLRVLNGKNTNGRAHGRYRHLNLSRLAPAVIEQVTAFAARMRGVHDSGQYPTFYQGAKKLLQRTNMKLHRRTSGKWVQIYSARHAFSTAAKKSLDQESVAAAMGHATTKTASAHYGRRSVAGGGLGATPVASEIMRVRLVRASRSAQTAAATPGGSKKHSS